MLLGTKGTCVLVRELTGCYWQEKRMHSQLHVFTQRDTTRPGIYCTFIRLTERFHHPVYGVFEILWKETVAWNDGDWHLGQSTTNDSYLVSEAISPNKLDCNFSLCWCDKNLDSCNLLKSGQMGQNSCDCCLPHGLDTTEQFPLPRLWVNIPSINQTLVSQRGPSANTLTSILRGKNNGDSTESMLWYIYGQATAIFSSQIQMSLCKASQEDTCSVWHHVVNGQWILSSDPTEESESDKGRYVSSNVKVG